LKNFLEKAISGCIYWPVCPFSADFSWSTCTKREDPKVKLPWLTIKILVIMLSMQTKHGFVQPFLDGILIVSRRKIEECSCISSFS
jgi:hypothetical protein